jgi:hypothetical protein
VHVFVEPWLYPAFFLPSHLLVPWLILSDCSLTAR